MTLAGVIVRPSSTSTTTNDGVAEDTVADVEVSGLWLGNIVTAVESAGPFWEADAEHQDYLERYPDGYTYHFPRPGWALPRRGRAA
ncbi:MAG: peptide-methionine (S)-S-oxide reductase [Acidimicrobiales bacterium]|jgi:peptide-methionine (S)-S-oxide reductase